MVSQSSSWDIVKASKPYFGGASGQQMAAMLFKLDHAVHAEPQHSRGFLAAALDLAKLSLLQDVTDVSAQAVRQVLTTDAVSCNAVTRR